MDAWLSRTKSGGSTNPLSKNSHSSLPKKKPYSRPLPPPSADSLLPINGGVRLQNRPVLRTLGAANNPVTGSTSGARAPHVQSCATGHQGGGGGGGSAWAVHRNGKLAAQAKEAESEVLKGVKGYINGYTGDITNIELIALVQRHGGKIRYNLSASCTHVFSTQGLSGSKTHNFLMGQHNRTKVVRPDWVLESILNGRRLDEAGFGVVYHEAQPSVLTTLVGPEADIRKRHVATYESALDVPAYVLHPVDRRKLAEPGPGIERRVEEVVEVESEEEMELDDWGMPPSAQRRRD